MDLDVTSLLEAALQQGIWAALYIYLFFRMLKENASREERYQNMIDRLSSNIENGIENMRQCRALPMDTVRMVRLHMCETVS